MVDVLCNRQNVWALETTLILTVEPVDLRDLPGLVVAPQERYPVRPLGLQRQQPRQRLEAVVAPVHKVPQEDVVRIRNLKKNT